jgi:uroporphyrinogen decarboxylase
MLAKKPKGATFFDGTYFPYVDGYPDNFDNLDWAMGTSLWAAMPAAPFNFPDTPEFWQELRQNTKELRASTDKAIMMSAGCNLFEWGTFLRRIDNFLMDVYADPYNVERLVDELMIRHMDKLEKICSAVGDIIDIVTFGDDLGMDNGPFMAPEIYRQLFKPAHTRLNEYVHKNTRMHTFLHSCGSIYQLMPDLIEAGFEIFNPVQTNAREMEPEKLKKEFGKDITFWGGGVDTRTVLNHGTPQQVKDQVKKRIEIFAPGGGFVFNTVHNILPDVPPENVVAMFETIGE